MSDFLYRPPGFIRSLFPKIIWKNDTDNVLITIDDGPSESTKDLLNVLKKYGIKALFFCTGKNIQKYPAEFEMILKDGHKIGSHGYDHKRLIIRSKTRNFDDIIRSKELIKKLSGKDTEYFRPPYGLFNHHTISGVKSAGMQMMLWSFLSGDHTGDKFLLKRLVNSYLIKGSILVLHDNLKSSEIIKESIKFIVDNHIDKGLKIDELNLRL